ncbi:MAG TPA: hypothetical protein VGC88_06760, partial [Terriglobales bacterium]
MKDRTTRYTIERDLKEQIDHLHPNEAVAYELHIRGFLDEMPPVGERETELVRSLADARWYLARIPRLEMEIYAAGRIQFANE